MDNIVFIELIILKYRVILSIIKEIILFYSYKSNSRITILSKIKSNYKYEEDEDIISLIDRILLQLEKISEIDFKNINLSLSILDEHVFR